MFYPSELAHHTPSPAVLISQKTILTINHATPITARPIAAFFSTVHHLLYLSSLPDAVIINNHPRIIISNAMKPKIPSTQFTHHLITLIRASPCHPSVSLASLSPRTAVFSAHPECFSDTSGFSLLSNCACENCGIHTPKRTHMLRPIPIRRRMK